MPWLFVSPWQQHAGHWRHKFSIFFIDRSPAILFISRIFRPDWKQCCGDASSTRTRTDARDVQPATDAGTGTDDVHPTADASPATGVPSSSAIRCRSYECRRYTRGTTVHWKRIRHQCLSHANTGPELGHRCGYCCPNNKAINKHNSDKMSSLWLQMS